MLLSGTDIRPIKGLLVLRGTTKRTSQICVNNSLIGHISRGWWRVYGERLRRRQEKETNPQDFFSDNTTLKSKYMKGWLASKWKQPYVLNTKGFLLMGKEYKGFQWVIIIMGWYCNGHWLCESYVKNTSKSYIIGLSKPNKEISFPMKQSLQNRSSSARAWSKEVKYRRLQLFPLSRNIAKFNFTSSIFQQLFQFREKKTEKGQKAKPFPLYSDEAENLFKLTPTLCLGESIWLKWFAQKKKSCAEPPFTDKCKTYHFNT